MSLRHLTPGGRGFLMVNAHPGGAAASVDRMWEQIHDRTEDGRRPVVLVVGSSAGYGLAATLAAARLGARGIGVSFEAPETERRTASAGWYRTARTAELVDDWVFLNADAFGPGAKADVVKLLAERFGPVDYLVYSVAAPRRTDPATGLLHRSVIKPLGEPYTAKTLVFEDEAPVVGSSTLDPADEAERHATVQVMGGADWRLWVDALDGAGLLADGFTTAALTYVGSELTAPIYRAGTIGAAKQHLERTARVLDEHLAGRGRAFTVVAGAAVTQASTAIPSIALYTSILHRVAGEQFESTTLQMTRMWEQLTGVALLEQDAAGRVRLDEWELEPDVQARVREVWERVTAATVAEEADTDWFLAQVGQMYGWRVPGVDYAEEQETTVAWPAD